MKIMLKNAILFMALLAFTGTGCDPDNSQPTITIDFDLDGFTKIDLGDALELDIEVKDYFDVVATGPKDDVEDLELEVKNGTLMSHFRPGKKNRKGVKVHIILPALAKLSLHSATVTKLSDSEFREEMEIILAGAAKLDAGLGAGQLYLEISGASEAKLSGLAQIGMEATVSGASKLVAPNFRAKTCDIEVSGKSEAHVLVLHKLTGKVNGKSRLTYSGTPGEVDVDVTSDSHLSKG